MDTLSDDDFFKMIDEELKNFLYDDIRINIWDDLVKKGIIKPKIINKNLGTISYINKNNIIHKAEIIDNNIVKEMDTNIILLQKEWLAKIEKKNN